MKRVIVGMSGGVDSSVAALLLKKQGYEVIGIYLKYSNSNIYNQCTWREDSKKKIIKYIYKEYRKGFTPNPDILCNSQIKFKIFLEKLIDLKSDFIATGHYVIKKEIFENGKIYYQIKSGIDQKKDQSYFLCKLNQNQIKKSLFPLGNLTKKEVRQIASKYHLINAKKKDSQGICFIGKIKLFNFLKLKLKKKEGSIIEINQNSEKKIIGKHIGAHFFTKGQRKGLKIGGYKFPLFVIEKDIKNNILYVGMGKNHPGLYTKVVLIKTKNIHWINPNNDFFKKEVKCRIRYRQKLQKATLYKKKNKIYVEFEIPQLAVNAGKFIVWYINNEVIGSGRIG